MLTPMEYVEKNYTLPFELYPFQKEIVNNLSDSPCIGLYLDLGTGKTVISTVIMLYKSLRAEVKHVVVLMPPILIDGWMRFLGSIPEVSVQAYRGIPEDRRKMWLDATSYTLMSYDVFKKDFDYISRSLQGKSVGVIADEATALKNISTKNYQKFMAFTERRPRIILTGTPISSPIDGYAYCRIVAPHIYRNKHHFESMHVARRDPVYKKVSEWKNLELLRANMKVNSARVLRSEVIDELPEVTYTSIPYNLDLLHHRFYRELAHRQLETIKDRSRVTTGQSSAIFNALQKAVVNYDEFFGVERRSAIFDVIDAVMAELNGRKLIVAGKYRTTNEKLFNYLQSYNPRIVYGGNTAKQNTEAIADFRDDHSVQVMHPSAGGYGIDGLQQVCSDVLFVESPDSPRDFHQLVGRVHRNGQKQPVSARIAYALDTIQVRLRRRLLEKDELANTLVSSYEDLSRALYGRE